MGVPGLSYFRLNGIIHSEGARPPLSFWLLWRRCSFYCYKVNKDSLGIAVLAKWSKTMVLQIQVAIGPFSLRLESRPEQI